MLKQIGLSRNGKTINVTAALADALLQATGGDCRSRAYSRGNAYQTTTAQIRGDPQSRTDEFIASAPGFLKNAPATHLRRNRASVPQSNRARQLCAHITGNFRQSRQELCLRLAKVQPFGCMNVLPTQWGTIQDP